MRSSSSPARLVIALSVAATLAIFLLYTSLAGGATPTLQPSQLHGAHGVVDVAGLVLAPVHGSPDGDGLRFALRDDSGRGRVDVVYHGAVPDLFRAGRHVLLRGRLQDGTFVGQRDSLVTKCPSKYVPQKQKRV